MVSRSAALRLSARTVMVTGLLTTTLARSGSAQHTLSNAALRVEFGTRGLTSLTDLAERRTYRFSEDGFSITVDGQTFGSAALPVPSRKTERGRVTYAWTAGPYRLDVVYELSADWRFVSKQIFIVSAPGAQLRVQDITLFDVRMGESPAEVYVHRNDRPRLQTGDYGAALRFGDARGLLVVAQNPFLHFRGEGNAFSLRYVPDMEWRMAYGPYAADRALLAPYRLTGRRLPAQMLPEWRLGANNAPAGMDEAEVDAFTATVRAFLLYRPNGPINVFVGWCVNDYQIDVASPEGREEYRRVMDRAAELGARYVLYAPSNSDLSRREESLDDWSWEHVLWLGLGQRIRANQWDPRTGVIPPSVEEMLAHARARNLKLLAYVYPVVRFAQNPEWLVASRDVPGRRYASLGSRSLQDWLIESLVAFHQRTGIGGYAFDHTFLTYDGTSRYAQWWGWRRVMEELRRRVPDIVIDGRQAYHLYGPWSWLAGSYPHPTMNDEQPESFVPFPDLHFDRVSADHQRFTAYHYRNYEFAPSEIVPGFITHQTSRSDDAGGMPETRTERGVLLDRFRARDWDYLGWRYSLLSSIATAGWNNVLNMIPARDLAEDRYFSPEDKAWFRGWLEWAATNKEYLRNTRTILGQPAIGKVDGTSAIMGDRGFVFLFNPNARALTADLPLDQTIGLRGRGPLELRELYPREGRWIGKPGAGFWAHGDRAALDMDGGSAMVLEIGPAPAALSEPALFNASGAATLHNGALSLDGLRGEAGTSDSLLVLLPQASVVRAVRVNGQDMTFSRRDPGAIELRVRFEGERFRQYQPIGRDDRTFAGGTFSATFTIPPRVFDQLAVRQRAWPIPWTAEDYRTTWLAPERLLLFVQIAEPHEAWEVQLRIDGRAVEVRKAYSAVRRVPRTFVGFYADVSLLSPDRPYTFELELPPLKPGQFQGVFFENIEPEYTDRIVPQGR